MTKVNGTLANNYDVKLEEAKAYTDVQPNTVDNDVKAKYIARPRGGVSDTIVRNTANTSVRVLATYTAAILSNVVNSYGARQLATAAEAIPPDDKIYNDSTVKLLNQPAPDRRSGLGARADTEPAE